MIKYKRDNSSFKIPASNEFLNGQNVFAWTVPLFFVIPSMLLSILDAGIQTVLLELLVMAECRLALVITMLLAGQIEARRARGGFRIAPYGSRPRPQSPQESRIRAGRL